MTAPHAGAQQASPAAPPASVVAGSASGGVSSFPIHSFAVQGNTLLGPEEVEAAVYPFLGDAQTLADAEKARAALERRYQARGFLSVVVLLPPQEVANNEVRLQVVQARIGQRRITGAQAHLPSRIAAATPSLAPGGIPDFERLQDELAALQANPDLRATPVVTAGRSQDLIDVELKIEDKLPLHGHVEANTRQSFNTERGRVDASVRYDNLFQRGHSLSATWIVAPTEPSQSNTRVFGYSAPWGTGPMAARLSANLVSSDSSTPSSLGGATVVKGETLGLRWRQPIVSAQTTLSQGWSAGVDLKSNRDRTRSGAGTQTLGTGLRYALASLGYDRFDGGSDHDRTQTNWDVQVAVGPRGLNERAVDCGGRSIDQFECKRAGASPGFELLKFNWLQRRPVFGNWQLSLRAMGQLAAHPLSSGEQIGAGGLDSVRGYFEYEQVGDTGLVLGAEVASPGFFQLGNATLNALAFVEGARLRVNEALPGEVADVRLRSLGFGLRLASPQGLRVNLDLALPLAASLKADSTGRLGNASGKGSDNDVRLDLSVRQSF